MLSIEPLLPKRRDPGVDQQEEATENVQVEDWADDGS